MNRVEVHAEEVPLPGWAESLIAFALSALDALGKTNWDLSILLCNDAYIRSLNSRYRDMDEPTDVLSFSLGETVPDEEGAMRYLPGDIVISLETLEENARHFRVDEDEELRRLVIHGILHLDGMDHEDNEPFRPMLRLQEELLKKLAAGGTLRKPHEEMRDFTYFEVPLGVCTEDFCDKSQKTSILGATPHKRLAGKPGIQEGAALRVEPLITGGMELKLS